MGIGLRPGAKAPDEPPTPYRLRASPRLYNSVWFSTNFRGVPASPDPVGQQNRGFQSA